MQFKNPESRIARWLEILPSYDMKIKQKLMVNEVIARFGKPDKIISDQGKQFESNLFKEICKLLQIGRTRTTAYRPESVGMVERSNRTLASVISMFVNDWDELLPYVTKAYRASEQENFWSLSKLTNAGS